MSSSSTAETTTTAAIVSSKKENSALKTITISLQREYKPIHATKIPNETNGEYFDVVNLTNADSSFYVSVATIGEAEVGKTTFLIRFAQRRFASKRIETNGYDYSTHWIYTNHPYYNRVTHVSLYDTAGQERYRAFSASILRQTEAILLMFDATNRKSYEQCRSWRNLIADNNQWCICMLIANKIDLYRQKDAAGKYIHDQWLILPDATLSAAERSSMLASGAIDLENAALELQCSAGCKAVSCATGENVDNAFIELIDLAINRQIHLAEEMNSKKHIVPSKSSARRQQKLDLRGGNTNNQAVKVTNNTTKISCC